MNTLQFRPDMAIDILNRNGWRKGSMGDANSKVCLHGALRLCSPQPGDGFIASDVYARRGFDVNWNDQIYRTQPEVMAMLEASAEITDAELAERFGPQWREWVELVRRAAVLTGEEAKALSAARSAAGSAARLAASEAAREVAWLAASEAAWEAAGSAASEAAGLAAWGAAGGLVARHKIGDKFTQEQYDTLTGPWRRVIGKIHQDDIDMKEQPNGN